MRRVVGILLLTGLLLVAAWPLPASAGGVQTTPATASQGALRADFNGDGVADLAIGAPGENNFSGVVHVLYGASPGGVSAAGSQVWSQNSTGIAGTAEAADTFGETLAAGDFNGNGVADLAIGAPGENNFSGVVHVLYGASPGGVSAAGSQVWSQNSTGIAGTAESSDIFGNSLAAGKLSTGGGGTATQEGASPTERNLTAPARP